MRLGSFLLFCSLLLTTATAEAKVTEWIVIPEESKLTFSVVQNHAPVEGVFEHFDASIHFDADRLEESVIKANIDMGSVNAAYDEVPDNLKKEEWFFVKAFPTAVFQTIAIKHVQDNQFKADATLTLRGKTVPVILTFTIDISGDTAVAHGNTILKRTKFGVGQGEWANTSVVEDDVTVDIALKAKKVE